MDTIQFRLSSHLLSSVVRILTLCLLYSVGLSPISGLWGGRLGTIALAQAQEEDPAPVKNTLTGPTDEFNDGELGSMWEIQDADDETIKESDGHLLHDSPKNYNGGGTVITQNQYSADGTVTFVFRMRQEKANYWATGIRIEFDNYKIQLNEKKWGKNDDLKVKITGGNIEKVVKNLADATSSSSWIEYSITVDFEDQLVTQVTRGGESYSTNLSFSGVTDDTYRLALADGRGHRTLYDYLRMETSSGGLADAPWPRFGHDIRATGRSPNAGPAEGTVVWTKETHASTNNIGDVSIGPDNVIYAPTRDEQHNSSDNENIYAFSSDGSLKWTYNAMVSGGDEHAGIKAVAIGDNSTIYASSNSDHLHAISADGSRKWVTRIQTQRGPSRAPVRTSDGTIYVGDHESELYAIRSDGSVKWSVDTGGRTVGPAIASDGTIYVGSGISGYGDQIGPGHVYAINPDGTVKWSYETEGRAKALPTVGPDGTVYVGTRAGRIYAFNSNGTVKWRYETDGNVRSSPAIGPNGTIYVGSRDDYFYALNPDGTLKWRYQTGGDIKSSPAIGGDGRIYVGSRDGKVYAFSSDGSVKWTIGTGNSVSSSPAIGADGRLYIGSGTTLYAIGGGGGGDSPIAPVADTTQQAGSEFWVDVKVGSDTSEVSDLFGTSFTLGYDESRLSVVDDEAGSFLGSNVVYSSNNDTSAGEIGIGVSRKSGSGGVNGSGTVARVKFAVAEDVEGGTTLPFSLSEVEANDPNDNSITLDPQSLDVEVIQGLSVWPGDTDNDGVVDQGDVLPLGQHWGSTGPARDSETCQWSSYTVEPWSPEAATYADANGDGTVDQADVLCIGQNWGQSHSTSGSTALAKRQAEPKGSVRLRQAETSGRTAWLELSVEGTGPVTGASAELSYPSDKASVLAVEPGPAAGSSPLFESNVDEDEGRVAFGASRKKGTVPEGSVLGRIKVRFEETSAESPPVTVREATAGLGSGRLLSLRGGSMELPSEVALQAPSPNPVRLEATVRYVLPESGKAELVLYNALGQKVRTLVSGSMPAGRHQTSLETAGLASGLYFLRLKTDEVTETQKVTVVQ